MPPVRTDISNQSEYRLEPSISQNNKINHYQTLPKQKKEDEDDFFIQKIKNRAHNLENKANLVYQQTLSNDLDEEQQN